MTSEPAPIGAQLGQSQARWLALAVVLLSNH